ncbi:MAG: M1 family metallopeptidase [Saprospiraceae bacterium]|uniref:M1 family metallopeptidase n=1 Tax=Candidatus Opimibacter skivensis TaxID=2982028 RepID=A0A9D7XN37_9BACT|nr:M1 family metallopeptidase [Candidatus Opimibacter skivensis]
MRKILFAINFFVLILGFSNLSAQPFTRQDTLRGSITPQRAWWDLKFYDLTIDFDIDHKFIKGSNTISFDVISPEQTMQIDLQEPLAITSAIYKGQPLTYTREGNVYWVKFPSPLTSGTKDKVTINYEGNPVEAVHPPWDGGLTWSTDDEGAPFVATSCQGLGSSVWWPCKDHMYDEPDSMSISITVPPDLMDVSNGHLRSIEYHPDGRNTYHWFVKNPINNYGVNANIGRYTHWSDTLQGEKGILDLDFFVLQDDYDKAREQFKDVYRTIRAFEYWFGPYPFYEDGYKLVQVPYLGMEHQSSVTYGNKFKMGYLGMDLSSTGWGLKWDFIIVHESAHEWWANNITYKDMADMWIHESFANYAESLFLDYYYGRQAANEYVQGIRTKIENKKPIIGPYNVNQEGSKDMYYKGGNMLHTIRTMLNDDVLWRSVLRGLQQEFYHQTVTTAQIEDYISKKTNQDLHTFFNQYLRDPRIPVLEYQVKGNTIQFRYTDIVEGFNMPLRVTIAAKRKIWIQPNAQWQSVEQGIPVDTFEVDPNFYITVKEVKN